MSERHQCDPRTLALLACPLCKGRLVWHASTQELICRGDRLAFPVREGCPYLDYSAARELSTEELERLPT
ncbi:Trm112 family protein [Pseudidiomarina sediminum]|uniref:Trm112 family protein n=1 Tax=Pseudidiomarina sediminum TaxID=431675 RepID=UPI001C97467A|nr:Trm112 family protein [Pseudidiomarina sediminum]MBY6062788.1 Trm112 family protein [Pseudidiomarina sediminum]